MSIYMKVDGIDGNITAKGLEKHVELMSYSWGASKKVNQTVGNVANREGSIPSFAAMTIKCVVDETLPRIFQSFAANKETIKTIDIKCAASNGEVYYTISLDDVIVSAYSDECDATIVPPEHHATLKPIATISFAYNKISLKYTQHDKQNKAGSQVSAGYDLGTAAAA